MVNSAHTSNIVVRNDLLSLATRGTTLHQKGPYTTMQVTYLDDSRILHLNASSAITEKQIVDGILLNPLVNLALEDASAIVAQMIDAIEETNIEYRPVKPLGPIGKSRKLALV